ncbi:hypothetical protein JB92DRAFT_2878836 [Gautieria morchelliformis]|nr:hypothetical protein JB92DRAFT_2878836 [Gautieria morchelliformis]
MPRTRSLRSYAFSGSKSPTRATSPTFSSTTNASQMDLSSVDTIITRKDLRVSIQAYDDLITSCTAYRSALMAMSHASSNFANAMDACSRLKGVTDDAGVNFQAAGGLHYLMANHWDVLGSTLEQQFEDPLRQHLGHYKSAVVERSAAYERTLLEKSKIIKQTEAENVKYGRQKKRDLQSFRQALSILQAEVDELDRLKVSHYNQILDHEEEIWDVVAGKVCLVVRSSLDVFDRVTSKASDSVLETMVQSIPDPFDSYGPPKQEGQLFSILAPLAMTPDADPPEDGVNSWTGEFGVAFPGTERTLANLEDAPGRTRRHSAPMASSSNPPLASSSLATHAPSPTRRPQLPTILSVIDENRGRLDAQHHGNEDSQRLHQSTSSAQESPPECQSPTNDITPTNSILRPSSPRVATRSRSPVLRELNRDQDVHSQVAA